MDKMAEANRKETRFAEDLHSIYKERFLISLLLISDIKPQIRKRFLCLSRIKAFSELEKNYEFGQHNI